MKLPSFELDLPKPRPWDLIAGAAPGAVVILALVGWRVLAGGGSSIPGAVAALFVSAQIALAATSLLLLGKTAKEGTIWGNLAAVVGLLLGLGGALMSTALWVAA